MQTHSQKSATYVLFFYSFVPVCLGLQCEGVSVCACVWYVNTQIIVTFQTTHRMSYKNLLTTLTVVLMGLTKIGHKKDGR